MKWVVLIMLLNVSDNHVWRIELIEHFETQRHCETVRAAYLATHGVGGSKYMRTFCTQQMML